MPAVPFACRGFSIRVEMIHSARVQFFFRDLREDVATAAPTKRVVPPPGWPPQPDSSLFRPGP